MSNQKQTRNKKQGNESKKEDIEKLPLPWFGISHRIDNYEDIIRLDEIQVIRTVLNYNSFAQTWDIHCAIMLKGGQTFEMDLTPESYDELIRPLSKIKESYSQPAPKRAQA